MPNKKELITHSDCRSWVCFFCFNKCSRILLDFPEYIDIIKNEIIEDFNVESIFYPSGICDTHKRYLNHMKQMLSGKSSSQSPTFDVQLLRRYLGQTKKVNRDADMCQTSCLICQVAKAKGKMVKKFFLI